MEGALCLCSQNNELPFLKRGSSLVKTTRNRLRKELKGCIDKREDLTVDHLNGCASFSQYD